MSYYDQENLPFGVSSSDANQMGISPWDSRQTAFDKWHTHEMEKQNQSWQDFHKEQDAARQGTGQQQGMTPTGAQRVAGNSPQASEARLLASLQAGKFYTTGRVAAFIEEKRQKLQFARKGQTDRLLQCSNLAWGAAAALFVVVLLGIKIPFVPPKFMAYEYVGLRAALVAALICGWRLRKAAKNLITQEEKDWDQLGKAMLVALEKFYVFKKEKSAGSGYDCLLGRYSVPDLVLHPHFISDFNAEYNRATGQDIPFSVYQFNEICSQQVTLIPNDQKIWEMSLQYGKIVDLQDVPQIKLADSVEQRIAAYRK